MMDLSSPPAVQRGPRFERVKRRLRLDDRTVAVLVPVLLLGVLGWSHRWIADDGLINVRVVRQLLAGHGPVFNVGQRVEVGTSPLWIYLLAVLRLAIPVDIGSLAVWAGLSLSVVGLALAQLGSLLLVRPIPRRVFVLPAGGLLVAALPPFWDFATSGLETGLSLAWAGASILGLGLVARRPDERRLALAVAAVAGAGPLVRPDLGIISVVLLAGLAVLGARHGWRRLVGLAVAAAALPVAYEIFRMGYYGLPVPTPAVAKEASLPRIGQGWLYLRDLVGTYWLAIPIAALIGLLIIKLRAEPARRQPETLVALLAPAVGGLLHASYIVFVGGDFMSGRLLLPSLFCVAAPVAVVTVAWPIARSWTPWAAALVVTVWAVVAGVGLRLPYSDVGPHGIYDERNFYRHITFTGHPVTGSDYRKSVLGAWAALGTRIAHSGNRRLCFISDEDPHACKAPFTALAPRWGAPAALVVGNLGAVGAETPTDLLIIDSAGLGDPVAAHVSLGRRRRPGHQKKLPDAWIVARFAAPSSPAPLGVDPAVVARARRALDCGELRDVDQATTAPLTAGRFMSNLFGSFGRMTFRFEPASTGAVRTSCGATSPR